MASENNQAIVELEELDVPELDKVAHQDDQESTHISDKEKLRLEYQRIPTEVFKDIMFGKIEGVVTWLGTLPPESKKRALNTMKWYQDSRALHLAVEARTNKLEMAKLLMDEGADPNVKREGGNSVLHVLLGRKGSDIPELVQLIIERGGKVDALNDNKDTPLHIASRNARVASESVEILLENNVNTKLKDKHGFQPIHEAAERDCHDIVEMLLQKNPESVHWKDTKWEQTPLHLVCFYSHNIQTAKLLIDKGANVNDRNWRNRTPLTYASYFQTNSELVKLLLDKGAEVNPADVEETPLQAACRGGSIENASLLLKHGAKVDSTALWKAVYGGNKDIVKQLLAKPQWLSLMRHTSKINGQPTEITTFCEMIKKMPDVAEEILNRCTVQSPRTPNPDYEYYRLVFDYEFVEDTRESNENYVSDSEEDTSNDKEKSRYDKITSTARHNYTTTWGPVGFKEKNHPLAIMVQSKRLNLLTHPLVGSLLHHKWQKFGQYGYFINLLTYCVYLIFLTTFALIVENPRSESCLSQNTNGTSSSRDCGIGTTHLAFIYISAVIVLIMSILRLILKGTQLVYQFPHYLLDWINWLEIVLFICSTIFMWVFNTDCLCPLEWQWQIGVVAVFLGWTNLIIFISKFPLTGIYVLMFIKILYTFLKILVFSILLVLAFGLTFYLTFTQPEILRSPFSTPAWSLLKMMSMTAGDFFFDSTFRLDPTGGSDDAEEIPFPPISYIMWILFVIIMPVLLTNMLVGLAVGDIQAVQDEATLQKLALQVEQVLTVEALLPKKLRRRFISGNKEVWPNQPISWRKKLGFIIWGGERYDTRDSIGKVLHPHKEESKLKTDSLLHKVEELKEESKLKTDNLLHEVGQLKEESKHQIEQLKEESKQKTDNLIHQIEELKLQQEESKLKTDNLMHQMEELKVENRKTSEQLLREVMDLKEILKTAVTKTED